MTGLQRKIEKIMDENIGGRFSLPMACLRFLSICYGLTEKAADMRFQRGFLLPKKLPCPVISIGNLCVGGTGKTPMTLYTAKMLQAMGHRVCILSRGYKGACEKSGGVVTDGKTMFLNAKSAGDEAYMMAMSLTDVPVFVGKDRVKSGSAAAASFHPDVMILDDGFQHRKLYRDIDIVLLDYQRPFGNHRLLPAGRLREPEGALSRADAIVFTRSPEEDGQNDPGPTDRARISSLKIPVFYARHKPLLLKRTGADTSHHDMRDQTGDSEGRRFLEDRAVFAFSGIARNDDFIKTIEAFGARVKGTAFFPDHHCYTQKELNRIAWAARDSGADLIVTTQKDDSRMLSGLAWPVDYVVIGVEICLGKYQDAYRDFLIKRISGNQAP
jgi:tetraacyldisaccharide 4'-kinase